MSLLETEKKAEERAKTIATERAKLTATFTNGVAIALIAVGALAPTFNPKTTPPSDTALVIQAVTNFVCLSGGLALHLLARHFLGSIR